MWQVRAWEGNSCITVFDHQCHQWEECIIFFSLTFLTDCYSFHIKRKVSSCFFYWTVHFSVWAFTVGKRLRMLLFFALCVDLILDTLVVMNKILYGCCEIYWQYGHTGYSTLTRRLLLDVSSEVSSGTGIFLQALCGNNLIACITMFCCICF